MLGGGVSKLSKILALVVCTRKPAAPGSTTCNLNTGAVMPMPTLVSDCTAQAGLEFVLPKIRELLCVTREHAPIAVALVKLFEPKET